MIYLLLELITNENSMDDFIFSPQIYTNWHEKKKGLEGWEGWEICVVRARWSSAFVEKVEIVELLN